MRIIFSVLSIAYVTGIFLFADSSVVSDLSAFNPYSLLHIPLYGLLAFLLLLSLMPLKFNSSNLNNPSNPTNNRTYFFLSGGIASIVAIADEIHQIYVPGREGSAIDVFLDMIGIGLALFLSFRFLKTKTSLIGSFRNNNFS